MWDNSHPLDMSCKVTHHNPPHLQICPPPHPEQSHRSQPQTPPPSQPGISPPSRTKIVKKTPSSPREFFAKLYGPDTDQDTGRKPHNPPQDIQKTFLHFPPSVPPLDIHPYLPTYPLPPYQTGLLSFDALPFPAGLADFCKYHFVQNIFSK